MNNNIRKAALVCCSNGQSINDKELIGELRDVLSKMGIDVIRSRYMYADANGFCGTAMQRAEALMEMYRNPEVDAIFDISGGDVANEILPYLDYEGIAASGKTFWGYSDLTTVINAVYAKTGTPSMLYQVRNLVGTDEDDQQIRFEAFLKGSEELILPEYTMLQGDCLSGVVVGGNIRCLLKLAGTPYWPDMNGKVLLLEARSGRMPQIAAYFMQLKQMGVFEQAAGVLLGTFVEMEKAGLGDKVYAMLRDLVGAELPVAQTKEIGHRAASKGIIIGKEIHQPG